MLVSFSSGLSLYEVRIRNNFKKLFFSPHQDLAGRDDDDDYIPVTFFVFSPDENINDDSKPRDTRFSRAGIFEFMVIIVRSRATLLAWDRRSSKGEI